MFKPIIIQSGYGKFYNHIIINSKTTHKGRKGEFTIVISNSLMKSFFGTEITDDNIDEFITGLAIPVRVRYLKDTNSIIVTLIPVYMYLYEYMCTSTINSHYLHIEHLKRCDIECICDIDIYNFKQFIGSYELYVKDLFIIKMNLEYNKITFRATKKMYNKLSDSEYSNIIMDFNKNIFR